MYIAELETFVHLSHSKNFTKTAEDCHLVQSTVSNRIKKLEKRLGVDLFKRNNKTVELTLAGVEFLDYAERMLSIHQSALKNITVDTKYKEVLKVGLTYSVYNTILKDKLLDFTIRHTDDALDITILHSDPLFDLMNDQLIDIAFVTHRIPTDKLIFEKVASDRIACVTSFNNTKYKAGITVEELKEEQVLYCDILPRKMFSWFESIFGEYYRFKIKINVLHEILEYVKILESYSFIPYKLAQPKLESGELIEIPLLDSEPPVLEYFIITNKNSKSTAILEDFRSFINM